MMSLIIEDKNALDNLADTIIGANGSVTDTSATKSGLIEMINNIIPEKSKFASGVFTPSEDITTQNGVRISYALGNDDNGIPIKPNVIIAYQPFALTDPTPVYCTCYRIYTYGTALVNPVTYPTALLWNYSLLRKSETTGIYYTTSLQTGSFVSDTEDGTYIFGRNGFKLQPVSDTYPLLAGHPIVWLQIKF